MTQPDLAARVSALERQVAELQRRLGERQPALDVTELLAEIAAVSRGAIFSVAELRRHAEVVGAEELLDLLQQHVGRSPRRLGKLLARLAEAPSAGWRIERMGEEQHATLWRVTRGLLR